MDEKAKEILFSLVRSAMTGKPLPDMNGVEAVLPQIQKVAHIHDIGHLVAMGIEQNLPLEGNTKQWVKEEILRAMYRFRRQKDAADKLCGILEEEKIPFIPLKGTIICQYYPEAWMRTSCDTDILIHEEDLGRAVECLTERHGYAQDAKGSHDVALTHENGAHLELHYTLMEDGVASESSQVLSRVWESTVLKADKRFWREMTDEMFYFYHIAHMAKHFENGGCGIRTFIDLWLLDRLEGVDTEKRDALLQEGKLWKFAEAARNLSRVWMQSASQDAVTAQMEDFILRGGVYGTIENRVSVQQQQRGGAWRYAVSRLFLPYDVIKFHYPVLNKYPWLLPVMEVRRWLDLAFGGKVRSSYRELKQNSTIPADQATKTRAFLDSIGL